MTKYLRRFSGESGELPDDVRRAFLEILHYTILHIRSFCDQRELCFTLADHAHNISGFLRDPKPELLCFYWECERVPFVRNMDLMSQKVAAFEPAWKFIEREYERVKASLADSQGGDGLNLHVKPRYRVTLTCAGLGANDGEEAARDIEKEFAEHRQWHAGVSCNWDGSRLIFRSENDFDENGSATLDEFRDCIEAYVSDPNGTRITLDSVLKVNDDKSHKSL